MFQENPSDAKNRHCVQYQAILSSMAPQQVSAKSLLHTFLDRAEKGSRPTYTTSEGKNALGNYDCICTLPKVSTATGTFETQQFTGEGASRSTASAKAAEEAWAFVQGTKANEAFTFKRFKQDLWTAICSSFTPEVRSYPTCLHSAPKHNMQQPAAAAWSCTKTAHPPIAMFL